VISLFSRLLAINHYIIDNRAPTLKYEQPSCRWYFFRKIDNENW